MVLESVRQADAGFEYKKLSEEEMQRRGILGRLVGPCADFIVPTRNKRKYSEELWEKVFENPIMQEKLKNKCCFGELGHPTDRTEIDMEKVAICLAEQPKKSKDGKLLAVFDILNTPNGKILKSLCDYGCIIGVSSRGNGETYTDYDGEEAVDPDTYDCECWDAVLIPAVEAARMTYVTESLNNNKTLTESLSEVIDNASEDDKKIMTETLDNLHIAYQPNKVENINANSAVEEVATSESSMLKDLQEALQSKQKLENKVTELQEKLSVSYAKEAEQEELIEKYKSSIISLSDTAKTAKALNVKVSNLQEQLNTITELSSQKDREIKRLNELMNKNTQSKCLINEKLSNEANKVESLNKEIRSMNKDFSMKERDLQEAIEDLKKDSAIKNAEYSNKLSRANALVERYKTIAKAAVDRYINEKASMLGVSSTEISNKLGSTYSFGDIDRICEDLRSYKMNLSKLPMASIKSDTSNLNRAKVTTAKPVVVDDVIDDSLLELAGLK